MYSEDYTQALKYFNDGLEIIEYSDNPDLLSERLEIRFLRGICKLHIGDNKGFQDCNAVLSVYKLLCDQDDQYNRLVDLFESFKPKDYEEMLLG